MQTDPAALGVFIDAHATRSLFRLETLDRYEVASDGADYEAYLAGKPGPDAGRKAAWHKVLQADLDKGVKTSRVHVVRSPLTDYLRYEFEWGYAHNLAYEDIRIADLAESEWRTLDILEAAGDFWLINDRHVAVMRYDDAGRYLGFDQAPAGDLPLWLAVRDAAWRHAIPFSEYWDGHRQYWRANRHAA